MSASSGRRSTTRSGSRKASTSTVARRAPRRSTRSHTREMQQTVLVVDDEPIVRDVVVRYLERDGFRTLTASDGDAAKALIEEREPTPAVPGRGAQGGAGAGPRRARRDAAGNGRALALPLDPRPFEPARDPAHGPRRGGRPHRRARARSRRLRHEAVPP